MKIGVPQPQSASYIGNLAQLLILHLDTQKYVLHEQEHLDQAVAVDTQELISNICCPFLLLCCGFDLQHTM